MRKIERGGVSPTAWEKRKTRLSIALENIEKYPVVDFFLLNFIEKNGIHL
jgi:hypothetical protein